MEKLLESLERDVSELKSKIEWLDSHSKDATQLSTVLYSTLGKLLRESEIRRDIRSLRTANIALGISTVMLLLGIIVLILFTEPI